MTNNLITYRNQHTYVTKGHYYYTIVCWIIKSLYLSDILRQNSRIQYGGKLHNGQMTKIKAQSLLTCNIDNMGPNFLNQSDFYYY